MNEQPQSQSSSQTEECVWHRQGHVGGQGDVVQVDVDAPHEGEVSDAANQHEDVHCAHDVESGEKKKRKG